MCRDLAILEEAYPGGGAQPRALLRIEPRGDGVDDGEVTLHGAVYPQHNGAGGRRALSLHDVQAHGGVGQAGHRLVREPPAEAVRDHADQPQAAGQA